MTLAYTLREALRGAPNGLTTHELAKHCTATRANVRRALNNMLDVISIGEVPGKNGSRIKLWVLARPVKPLAPVAIGEPHTVWIGGPPKLKWR